jgi:hypothetical protein
LHIILRREIDRRSGLSEGVGWLPRILRSVTRK